MLEQSRSLKAGNSLNRYNVSMFKEVQFLSQIDCKLLKDLTKRLTHVNVRYRLFQVY